MIEVKKEDVGRIFTLPVGVEETSIDDSRFRFLFSDWTSGISDVVCRDERFISFPWKRWEV